MSNALEANFEMVYGFEIPTDEVWTLLSDVAAASTPEDDIVIPENIQTDTSLPTGNEELNRMALGVRDSLGRLVAYASATIDNDENHATVDCMVVHPSVAQEGIGKWLADEGLRQLDEEDDTQTLETVSFENFGQVGFLLPYLIQHHGFEYNGYDEEYVRKCPAPAASPKPPVESAAPIELLENIESETERRPIGNLEMGAFKSTVHDLIRECTEYALKNRMLVSSYNEFDFRSAGQLFTVLEVRDKDNKSWEVIEHDVADLVASSHGIVMATERRYEVIQSSDSETYHASCAEKHEVRGEYGAMHPFVNPSNNPNKDVFTAMRFDRVMAALTRLGPDSIVPEPDPSAEQNL